MNATDVPPSPRRARAYAPAWLTLLAGFLVSGVAAGWFWNEAEHQDKARFDTAVTNLIEDLDTRTERYAEQLERFTDLIANQPDVSEAAWIEIVTQLSPPSNLPAFLELAYATNTALPTRAELEVQLKAYLARSGKGGLPHTAQPSLNLAHHWRNASSITPQETEVWLHEPRIPYQWWGTINGRMMASPRRLLPGADGERRAAVSLFVPVFATDLHELSEYDPTARLNLRRYRFKGLVIGTIGWQTLLDTAFPGETKRIAFEAFASANNTNEINAETWMGVGGRAASQVLKPEFAPRFQHTRSWPFYRERWQLVFYTTKLFDLQSTRYRAWVALGGGISLTVLMAGLLAVQVRARHIQEAIADELRLTLAELGAARKERERLSHDLHDGAIQSLYAMQLSMSRAAELAEAAQPILGRRLSDIRRNLTSVIGELRGFILQHEAEPGPAGDLASVLAALVERLDGTTETSVGAELSSETARDLTGEQAVHLANLAREALSNALRHARAGRIVVALRDAAEGVALEIRDDGCGFSPASPPHTGLGLTSMASRAREAGGELRIESQSGQGTRVAVMVPVRAPSRSLNSGENSPNEIAR